MFTTPFGAYEPLVMYFGLMNSPATFQTMMNELFWDMINEGKVIIYLDNILIYTKGEKEDDELVKEVLKQLRENDLFVKPEKCHWKVTTVEFLGVILTPGGIKMDPDKIKAIVDWPIPKCMKDIQRFLGLANYYQRFILAFASSAHVLHALVGKDKKWVWNEKENRAFNTLKEMFTQSPVLVPADSNKRFRVELDASDYAVTHQTCLVQ